jgi:predicted lipid-binding transport protein (Tim44 family)
LQVLELIIFAGLAAIVLYQLYSVLGRRVGRQPEDNPAPEALPGAPRPADRPLDIIEDGVALSGLAAVRARDPSFDPGRFLSGAKSAYEMVVRAFAGADRDTLRNLLSPKVMASFDAEIAARVTVRFLAEFRSRTKGPEGEAVDDRRTAELWTFERNLKSRDPNWTLVHVDAAEA